MSPFTLGVFLSFLGDLWAFLPIYLPTIAAANSNVPFSLEAKNLEHYKLPFHISSDASHTMIGPILG